MIPLLKAERLTSHLRPGLSTLERISTHSRRSHLSQFVEKHEQAAQRGRMKHEFGHEGRDRQRTSDQHAREVTSRSPRSNIADDLKDG